MNPFAAKQSGAQSLIESLLPKEVMEAINLAKTELPMILELVKNKVENIEATQLRIEANQQVIMGQLEEFRLKLDPDATPKMTPLLAAQLDMLPIAEPNPTGTKPTFQTGV